MKKLTVIHTIRTFKFGGIETLVYDLVKSQDSNSDVSPKVLVNFDEGEFGEKFYNLGIPISKINAKIFNPLKIRTSLKLLRFLKECDVVHMHGFNVNTVLIALLLKKKIVYTEHGNFGFGRKKTVNDRVSHVLRRLFFNVGVDMIICNSNFTLKYLKGTWKVKGKAKVVHNGSNVSISSNSDNVNSIKNTFDHSFLIGTTSRLASVKKVNRLIEAFHVFNKENANSKLIIVGDGPEKGRLESLAGECLNKSIYFVGFKSNPHDYQSAFDICVFPSQNESFGLVAVESYCSGRPVIVFKDGGGLTEIVSLCDSNDIVDSVEGLVRRFQYYKDNYQRKDVTEVLNYFSIERMTGEYTEIYKEIICVE